MGKKRKTSTVLKKSPSCDVSSNCTSLLENIITDLRSIKESNGLIIGTNAVLRGLRRDSVDVVLLVSKKASSVLYQAVSLLANSAGAVFYQLRDTNPIGWNSGVRESTTYGIKISALTGKEKFSELVEKVKNARSSLKSKRKKILSNKSKLCQNLIKDVTLENAPSGVEDVMVNNSDNAKFFIHKKPTEIKPKYIGNAESFISLNEYSTDEINFPNYSSACNKINISIR